MSARICIACLSCLLFLSELLAQSGPIRIESEYKLSVPDEQVDDLWIFLQENFSTQKMQVKNPAYSTQTDVEIFYDTYYDTEDLVLYGKQAGVRLRKRYVNDSLAKELLQIKLPTADSTGVARHEIKFEIYEQIKKGDLLAMHPLFKHLKPKDRKDFNHHIAPYGIKAENLTPKVKVKQKRRRVYVSDEGVPLLTITLDDVRSRVFPFPKFTELELELNEIRYTDAGTEEKVFLENLNTEMKKDIATNFPDLKQDQTPKYNKMTNLLKDNLLYQVYDNMVYILLGIIVLFALGLYLKVYYRKHAHKRQRIETVG